MSGQAHLKNLVKVIGDAIGVFDGSLSGIEEDLLKTIEELLTQLELKDGRIRATSANLRIIARIRGRLENMVVNNSRYEKNISKYLEAFEDVTKLQQIYFQAVSTKFKPTSFLKEIQKQSIDATLQSLTRSGISAEFITPIQDILRQNVTTGTSYVDLLKQLRMAIKGDKNIEGGLSKYVKTVTTDALNQYAAQYMEVVSSDLGLQWFQYTGVKMVTSRAFCQAMVNKRFFHRMEVPNMIAGEFKEFYEVGGTLNKKTQLPDGMVAGTNPENFFVYRGGWNCHHQAIPVSQDIIPVKDRLLVYDTYGIPYDGKGFARSA